MVQQFLASQFSNQLASDCSGGFSGDPSTHQHCWVQRVRDRHALKEMHPGDVVAQAWAQTIRTTDDTASGQEPVGRCCATQTDSSVRLRPRA